MNKAVPKETHIGFHHPSSFIILQKDKATRTVTTTYPKIGIRRIQRQKTTDMNRRVFFPSGVKGTDGVWDFDFENNKARLKTKINSPIKKG
jgi:hypothetical protein